jgi:hypothetical protein
VASRRARRRTPPPEPLGLIRAGKRLWDDVTASYDFDPVELVVLGRACNLAELVGRLEMEVILLPSVLDPDPYKGVHPVIKELRAMSAVQAKLLATLRLPDADGKLPQRRAGSRGSYGARGRKRADS